MTLPCSAQLTNIPDKLFVLIFEYPDFVEVINCSIPLINKEQAPNEKYCQSHSEDDSGGNNVIIIWTPNYEKKNRDF